MGLGGVLVGLGGVLVGLGGGMLIYELCPLVYPDADPVLNTCSDLLLGNSCASRAPKLSVVRSGLFLILQQSKPKRINANSNK